MFCDLHMHSTCSDGTIPPEQLPLLAREAGLSAIALTDHDTTAGLPACAQACAASNIEFVPGIEVSTDPLLPDGQPHPIPTVPDFDGKPMVRGTLHILGLFIRHDDPMLAALRDQLAIARNQRTPLIIDKLNQLGIPITEQDVIDHARALGTQSIGRPHIGGVLTQRGYVRDITEAFGKYLGQGKPAYVRKDLIQADQTIAAIHHAGGLAILAHAVELRITEPHDLERYILRLKALGLDGVEARHSKHDDSMVAWLDALASRHGLVTTGGSDFHGASHAVRMGAQHVPISVCHTLRETWRARRHRSDS